MVLAIACDALRIALAHVGRLSERRMAHLWDAFFQNLSSGGPRPGVAHGLQLRYPAAELLRELKQLAAPATLDTPLQDLGVEDHGTAAPLSVGKTDTALGMLEDLLAIEMVLAHDVLATAPTRRTLGAGTAAAMRIVENAIAIADPRADSVHQAVRARIVRPPDTTASDSRDRP